MTFLQMARPVTETLGKKLVGSTGRDRIVQQFLEEAIGAWVTAVPENYEKTETNFKSREFGFA